MSNTFRSGIAKTSRAYIDDASRHLNDTGVVIVEGFDQRVVDDLYREAAKFFGSDRRYLFSGSNWGYLAEGKVTGECERERFDFRNPRFSTIEVHRRCDIGIKCMPKGEWPTYREFPMLRPLFTELFDSALDIGQALSENVMNTYMSIFKYQGSSAGFRIRKHEDDSYTINFTPQGESLEVLLKNRWTPVLLEGGNVAVVGPRMLHRVQNQAPHAARYSIVFSYDVV